MSDIPAGRSEPAGTREAVQARFADIRAETERLTQALGPEDQTVQSMPDCSPVKIGRAHV